MEGLARTPDLWGGFAEVVQSRAPFVTPLCTISAVVETESLPFDVKVSVAEIKVKEKVEGGRFETSEPSNLTGRVPVTKAVKSADLGRVRVS